MEDSLCILMATLLGVDQARAEVIFYTSTNHKPDYPGKAAGLI